MTHGLVLGRHNLLRRLTFGYSDRSVDHIVGDGWPKDTCSDFTSALDHLLNTTLPVFFPLAYHVRDLIAFPLLLHLLLQLSVIFETPTLLYLCLHPCI